MSFEIRANLFGKTVNERYTAEFLCDNCGNYHKCLGYKEENCFPLPCAHYFFSKEIEKEMAQHNGNYN